MANIDSLDHFFLILTIVVPGFLLHATLEKFSAISSAPKETTILRFVVLSAFNYGFCSPLVYLLIATSVFKNRPLSAAFSWGFIVFLSPMILGLASALATNRGIGRRLFQKFGLNPVHHVPTGWDWQFGRMKQAHWVAVTLKNGSKIAGLFDDQSMASSTTNERDLYISKVYTIVEDSPWQPVPRSAGKLIAKDQICEIEFWSLQER